MTRRAHEAFVRDVSHETDGTAWTAYCETCRWTDGPHTGPGAHDTAHAAATAHGRKNR